jgi:hypothetical protein
MLMGMALRTELAWAADLTADGGARRRSGRVEVEFEDGLSLVHFASELEAVLLVERDG